MPKSKLRLTLFLIPLALLVVINPGTAQNPQNAFSPGESLTYDVTWTVFRAGVVTFNVRDIVENNKKRLEATATAKSEGFVPLLFDVDDHYRSTSDADTLCSDGIAKKINEGHRHKDTHVFFDYGRQQAILEERDLNQPQAPAKLAENEIPSCVQDVITAFYYVRRQKLEVGKTIELPVNDGSKTQRVVVDVQAKEKVQTPMGTYDAFRCEPKVFNGLLKRKGRMLIWFSADERQLPLRVKAMIAVGSITGTLRSVTYPKQEATPATAPTHN